MSCINKEDVIQILKTIYLPEKGCDVVTAGLISGVVVKDQDVGFIIEVTEGEIEAKEALRKSCEKAVLALPAVRKVAAVLTSPIAPSSEFRPKTKDKRLSIPGVKSIIAVASGKGGVGKSTTAVHLSVALAATGLKVGLVDADIYGPSVPRMMNIYGTPDVRDNRIIPFEVHGVKVISMGHLIPESKAAIWRGPMITKALHQLMRITEWGETDVLFVDMPPGTGDIHLSMGENYPVVGVVIVSTPQEIALLDVRKAIDMYQKLDVPVIGVIENMSYFLDPVSQYRHYLFGEGGAKRMAETMRIPFLGEVPFYSSIREASDKGEPVVNQGIYSVIIKKLIAALS